jgi:prolyl-tRNA synthetase
LKLTTFFFQTAKQAPSDCETQSAILLARAGYVAKLGTGIYSYLPLAQRALQKIRAVLKEEMNRIGGQEILMPVVHPAELWKKTGRYDAIGDELVRFEDRRESQMVLAMTHEEVVAHLASQYIKSYRQMPALVYQIQTKFRDEPRSRGGLIRVREFDMKDSYSLDADTAGLDVQYARHQEAYARIFHRVGLPVVSVKSDTGMMGGKQAHEYMFLSPIGEDHLVTCPACGYAANQEAATFRRDKPPEVSAETTLTSVPTPGVTTIADLAAFLKVDARTVVKHVCFTATFSNGARKLCVALVRGDHDVNVTALRNLLGAMELAPATAEEIIAAGLLPGYVGLHGIEKQKGLITVADVAVAGAGTWVIGANQDGEHFTGAQYGRDFIAGQTAELAMAAEGFPCPECGEPLRMSRGVEVGNIFKLGTKYSAALGANFLDQNGKSQPIVMGSYGIGVGRLLACIAEHHSDAKGLRWPITVAPFQVVVVGIGPTPEVATGVRNIYEQLQGAGLEVLWDDRELGPGAKLTDSELLGIPVRIVISDRTLATQEAEIMVRSTGATERVKIEGLFERVQAIVGELRAGLAAE